MIARSLAAELIRSAEGLRLTVYDDATGSRLRPGAVLGGKPTIGYGRNLCDRGISAAEAELLLQADLDQAERDASEWLGPAWRELAPLRQAVLMDMALNLGRGGLAGFKKLRAAIACGDWAGAAREMLDSAWARQVGARARRNARIMATGKAEGGVA